MASISWSISKHEQLHVFSPMRVHFITFKITETRFIKASIISDSFYGKQTFTIMADNAPLSEVSEEDWNVKFNFNDDGRWRTTDTNWWLDSTFLSRLGYLLKLLTTYDHVTVIVISTLGTLLIRNVYIVSRDIWRWV